MCDTDKGYAANGEACFPLDNVADLGWSLSEIFGKPVTGTCRFGIKEGEDAQRVFVEVPEQRGVFSSSGAQERKIDENLRSFVLPGERRIACPRSSYSTTRDVARAY